MLSALVSLLISVHAVFVSNGGCGPGARLALPSASASFLYPPLCQGATRKLQFTPSLSLDVPVSEQTQG